MKREKKSAEKRYGKMDGKQAMDNQLARREMCEKKIEKELAVKPVDRKTHPKEKY